jgi:hypothetical protein
MKWQKASKNVIKLRQLSNGVSSARQIIRAVSCSDCVTLFRSSVWERRQDQRTFGLLPALVECGTRFLCVTIAAGIVDTG